MNKDIKIVMDPFCYKQFDQKTPGTQILYDKDAFTEEINKAYVEKKYPLKDGYAPFCKHLFVDNFTETKTSIVRITEENKHLIKSDYESRRPEELPVLMRWINFADVPTKKADCLDIILYSREQVQKENESMKSEDPNKDIDYDYAIVSVKPQDAHDEILMLPITMMRNALGKEEGGSGVKLNRDEYNKSVQFWKDNVMLR